MRLVTHRVANPYDPPRKLEGFATTTVVLLIVLARSTRSLLRQLAYIGVLDIPGRRGLAHRRRGHRGGGHGHRRLRIRDLVSRRRLLHRLDVSRLRKPPPDRRRRAPLRPGLGDRRLVHPGLQLDPPEADDRRRLACRYARRRCPRRLLAQATGQPRFSIGGGLSGLLQECSGSRARSPRSRVSISRTPARSSGVASTSRPSRRRTTIIAPGSLCLVAAAILACLVVRRITERGDRVREAALAAVAAVLQPPPPGAAAAPAADLATATERAAVTATSADRPPLTQAPALQPPAYPAVPLPPPASRHHRRRATRHRPRRPPARDREGHRGPLHGLRLGFQGRRTREKARRDA